MHGFCGGSSHLKLVAYRPQTNKASTPNRQQPKKMPTMVGAKGISNSLSGMSTLTENSFAQERAQPIPSHPVYAMVKRLDSSLDVSLYVAFKLLQFSMTEPAGFQKACSTQDTRDYTVNLGLVA